MSLHQHTKGRMGGGRLAVGEVKSFEWNWYNSNSKGSLKIVCVIESTDYAKSHIIPIVDIGYSIVVAGTLLAETSPLS